MRDAQDTVTGAAPPLYALKEMRRPRSATSFAYRRFIQEIETTRRLAEAHAGIVRVVDAFLPGEPTADVPYYLMPWAAQTLEAARYLAGPDALKRVLRIGMRLVDALSACHQANPPVIHRDVKPANVLLVGDRCGRFGKPRTHGCGPVRPGRLSNTANCRSMRCRLKAKGYVTIPIIDVFAGPGGLAEGFSSLSVKDVRPFRIALSIEKDERAHETLLLRGFFRQFPDGVPSDYWRLMRGEIDRAELFAKYPDAYARARAECVRHELGPQSDQDTYALVRKALGRHSGPWGLIGGPPCQAYSLVGRSRNRGIDGYVPEQDHRQTLYVEYLQILADHQPAFFVMENVKGLLSATLQSSRLFERIFADLQAPAAALKREGRRARNRGRGPVYRIFPLAQPASGLFGPKAEDVIVRCEEHGIPQARHRVILLGVREDVPADALGQLPRVAGPTLRNALDGLPRLRSGLTDLPDEELEWRSLVASFATKPWVRETEPDVREALRDAAGRVRSFRAGRGAEFVPSRGASSRELGGFANHAARAHIAADLERYFFAACYAQVRGKAATLDEFPEQLLPNHANTADAVRGTLFSDRFRVQVWNRPATTITSHISKDGHYYIHPDPTQCRSLTVREAARLQTFPDDYLFCGPRTSQYQQVGNAVPPSLARQIADVVKVLV